MSTDDQQHRGGFVPIGELAGTLPGIVPRGRAMTAQTRHHFTMLRQVNQLIEAGEAEPDIGFMARLLALCSLPRTDPKTRLQYVRHNGPYTLAMTAGGQHTAALRHGPAAARAAGHRGARDGRTVAGSGSRPN